MQKRYAFFALALSALLLASVARAQDASTTEPVSASPQEVVAETPIPPVAKDPEERERRKTQLAPLTKDRTKNLLDNVMNRLVSATNRLDRIATRIETRIEKEEAAGIDGARAREALSRARAEIDRARRESSMVTEVHMDLIVDSEAPRISFQNLFARVSTTRTALESAKRELGASLDALAAMPPEAIDEEAPVPDETVSTTTP